ALVGFLALAASGRRNLARALRRPDLRALLPMLALFIRTSGLQPDVLRPQEQIELLYEVTTHLNTDLSLEKVMANILTQAIAKVGATRGSIFLLDENNRVSHRILARENLSPEVSSLVIQEVMSHGLAAWILQHKEGALIEDVLQDERWMVLPDHAGQVRSAVAVPFLRLGRVEGMLFLTHPEVGRFRREHLQLLTSIANQAAIAIQNARLYERVENERRTLSAVLDSSAEAVVVTDPAGRLLLANRSAQQNLGIENRAAPLADVVLHPGLLALLERAASEEGTVSDKVPLEDGRTLSVSVAPVRDREGRTIGRVAVMHDITYLVELDEMKSRFVSTVSHDLKAPLTAIRGYAELLRAVGPLNEEQALFSSRILEVTQEMSHLISNLLDLGKIEAGLGCEFQAVDLREVLIGSKYNLAFPAQQKGILIEVELPAHLPPVRGDPYRLQQVMANLVGNAIKYTPPGGRVWIRAEVRDEEVQVSVSDTGIGISPADLPHIFEKFFRVRDPRAGDEEGSGLGLAIVKSIVTEHGGRVWVESTVGRGSTFYFTLPIWAG
ncbi:MAG: ATP-binding protein, partial [Chloroflexia bacterium]